MTPQPKSRTIGCWLVLDDDGSAWLVQCLGCGRKTAFPRSLLSGPYPPRCKCGGKVPSKPVEASKPPAPAVVPVQVVAPVLTPVAKPKGTKPALIGKRPDSEMEADRVAAAPPAPPAPPAPERVKRQRRQPPPVQLGPIDGTQWTVLSEVTSICEDNRQTVFARCTCGKERNVVWCSIWIGKSKSCGCLRAKKLVEARRLKPNTVALPGMEYGAMTVQSEGPRRGRLRSVWCLCGICKTTRLVRVQDLRSYRGQTCSCAVAHRRDRETPEQRRARMAVITAVRVEGQRVRKIELLTAQIARLQDELARLQSPPTLTKGTL